MDENWPFHEPPNRAVISQRQVVLGSAPVLIAAHDAHDHGWQFLSGEPFRIEDAVLISFRHIVEIDPTLAALADLPPGWLATREGIDSPWSRERDESVDWDGDEK